MSVNSILIIKPSSLGDIIHAFPAFELIRTHCPGSIVDWVVNSDLSPLLEYLGPPLDRKIKFPRSQLRSASTAIPAAFSLGRDLRARHYDAVIDLQGLLRSAIMAKLACAPVKAGFAHPREHTARFLYNLKLSPPESLTHAVERNAYLVSKVIGVAYTVPTPSLPEHAASAAEVRQLLSAQGVRADDLLITIAPGARWLSKRWPAKFFAQVLDQFAKHFHEKTDIAIIGSSADRPVGEELRSACVLAKPFNLCGTTNLRHLVELIRRSRLLLCNDSGPMHIASALGVKVFALFGPTDPKRTGPYGASPTIFQHTCPCIQCLKRYCYNVNPLECQKGISATVVSERIVNFLTSR